MKLEVLIEHLSHMACISSVVFPLCIQDGCFTSSGLEFSRLAFAGMSSTSGYSDLKYLDMSSTNAPTMRSGVNDMGASELPSSSSKSLYVTSTLSWPRYRNIHFRDVSRLSS